MQGGAEIYTQADPNGGGGQGAVCLCCHSMAQQQLPLPVPFIPSPCFLVRLCLLQAVWLADRGVLQHNVALGGGMFSLLEFWTLGREMPSQSRSVVVLVYLSLQCHL